MLWLEKPWERRAATVEYGDGMLVVTSLMDSVTPEQPLWTGNWRKAMRLPPPNSRSRFWPVRTSLAFMWYRTTRPTAVL